MHSITQVILITTILVQCNAFDKLPPYIKPCNRSDQNFNQCAAKNGQAAVQIICEGDPMYHIPSFKPFKLDYVSLEASENIKLYANNVEISGFDKAEIEDVDWDFENKSIHIRMYAPVVNIKGTYNMQGRILIMNLKGSGPMNNTHYGNDVRVKCNYILITKHNKEYIQIDKVDVNLKILKGVNLFFGNLLNNTLISEQMNAFLNENWEILLEDLYPSVNKIMETVATTVLNPIAAKIPFSDLFTP